MTSDQRQETFANFVVPDQGRISKVYDWLTKAGRFGWPEKRVKGVRRKPNP